MADYYSILGVSKTANELEIKAAFRRLAKIYHPDKNPNNPDAKYVFENVLKAYNTLIHPSSRRRYDLIGRDTYTQPLKTQHAKRKGQKEWTFTEEDLKKRNYYETHYKAKQQEHQSKKVQTRKAHNDYKYILFATPIAVALLMLVISMFTETPKTQPSSIKTNSGLVNDSLPVPHKNVQLANGERPYSGFFGNIKIVETKNVLQINNSSAYDAIVAVFDKETGAYLQHAYLQSSYLVEFSKLPNKGVYWKCMLGKNWNKNKTLLNNTINGGFDTIVQFQNRKSTPLEFDLSSSDTQIDLLNVIDEKSKEKKYISTEKNFFKN